MGAITDFFYGLLSAKKSSTPIQSAEVPLTVAGTYADDEGEMLREIYSRSLTPPAPDFSKTFPREGAFGTFGYQGGLTPQEILESYGMKFTGPVEDDDLLQYIQLPDGWRWDEARAILDANGLTRVAILYNRRLGFAGHTVLYKVRTRYMYNTTTVKKEDTCVHIGEIFDEHSVLHEIRYEAHASDDAEYEAARSRAESEIKQLIEEKYPNWRDPTAYWD